MASIVIAQGGGPTAVINQTVAGAVISARQLDPGLKILGARNGVRGLVSGDLVDLGAMTDTDLMRLARTPNSGLGSTRDKPDDKTTQTLLEKLEGLDARAFIYIGGNDTSGTLELMRQQSTGPMRFVHAPKTIDNDLAESDHVPGFISAGLFVTQGFTSVDLDVRAMRGIYVAVVMGRHAGFLTASPSAWHRDADDAPHLMYCPEQPFSIERFLTDVEAVYSRLGRCVVSVSEGVQDENGMPLAQALAAANGEVERDAHGNVQLGGGDLGIEIQKALKRHLPKARSRVDTFGYLPRGFLGSIDPTDQHEAFAAGAFAAQCAFNESGSVALRYDGSQTMPTLVALDKVANRTRHMPESYFAGSGLISTEGREYFARLLPPRPDLYTPFV